MIEPKNTPKDIVDAIRPSLPSDPSVDPEPQLEQMVKDIARFGREEKKNGARSFAKLVKEMRRKQKTYFDTRSNDALKEAKKLEEQVDRTVEVVLR